MWMIKNVQTILGILFEHKELFIFILTLVFTGISVVLNHRLNKANSIPNINNNTKNQP